MNMQQGRRAKAVLALTVRCIACACAVLASLPAAHLLTVLRIASTLPRASHCSSLLQPCSCAIGDCWSNEKVTYTYNKKNITLTLGARDGCAFSAWAAASTMPVGGRVPPASSLNCLRPTAAPECTTGSQLLSCAAGL